MTVMAAVCGILIAVLGILSAGRAPNETQALTEITCLVGGLILCFIAVLLNRLKALSSRLDAFEVAAVEIAEHDSEGGEFSRPAQDARR